MLAAADESIERTFAYCVPAPDGEIDREVFNDWIPSPEELAAADSTSSWCFGTSERRHSCSCIPEARA